MRKPQITIVSNKLFGDLHVAWDGDTPYFSLIDINQMVAPNTKLSNGGRCVDKQYVEHVSDTKGTGGSKLYASTKGVKQFIKSKARFNKVNAVMVREYFITHVVAELKPPKEKRVRRTIDNKGQGEQIAQLIADRDRINMRARELAKRVSILEEQFKDLYDSCTKPTAPVEGGDFDA